MFDKIRYFLNQNNGLAPNLFLHVQSMTKNQFSHGGNIYLKQLHKKHLCFVVEIED